ncbi:MAG: PHP domain-containing protein [Thermodesulfobacteriota bacterium]
MFKPSAAVLPDFEETRNYNRICFSRPEINRLSESSTVVDMHFHSKYSDGQDDIAAIADRARSLGIGVAITDHNAVEGAVRMAEHKDVFSIPGIEVTSREGAHLLVYFHTTEDLVRFFEKELTPYLGKEVMSSSWLSMEAIVASARQYRSLIVFPHPYCAMFTGVCNPLFSRSRQDFLLSAADGIEVINAGNIHRWNIKSAFLGLDKDAGLTGGSDGHSLFQLGRAVTCAPCGKNAESFLENVRNAQTLVVGKEINILRKVASSGMKIRSNLRNSQDLIGKNMRYGYAVINSRSKRLKERIGQNLQK